MARRQQKSHRSDINDLPPELKGLSVSDKPNRRLHAYSASDRRLLTHNMRSHGMHPPSEKGYDAHHIVPLNQNDKGGYLEKSREILRRAGIDLNSHHNGYWAPSNRNWANTARRVDVPGHTMHQTLHSTESRDAYARELYETLSSHSPGGAHRGLEEMRIRLMAENHVFERPVASNRQEQTVQPAARAQQARPSTGPVKSDVPRTCTATRKETDRNDNQLNQECEARTATGSTLPRNPETVERELARVDQQRDILARQAAQSEVAGTSRASPSELERREAMQAKARQKADKGTAAKESEKTRSKRAGPKH